jgi:hypothetical protein
MLVLAHASSFTRMLLSTPLCAIMPAHNCCFCCFNVATLLLEHSQHQTRLQLQSILSTSPASPAHPSTHLHGAWQLRSKLLRHAHHHFATK